MNPLVIPAAVSGAQAIYGIWQTAQAKKAEKTKRPTMEIPEAERQALAIAERQASQTKIPGYDIYREQLLSGAATATAQAKEAAGGGASLLGATADIYGKTTTAEQGLNIASAQYQAQAQDKLRQQLGSMADWEQKVWGWEEGQPYMEEMARSSAMRGAGTQNIWGAASGLSQAALEQNMWDNYLKTMGGQSAPITTTQPASATTIAPTEQPTLSMEESFENAMRLKLTSGEMSLEDLFKLSSGTSDYTKLLYGEQGGGDLLDKKKLSLFDNPMAQLYI